MVVKNKQDKKQAFNVLEACFQNNPSVLNSVKQDKYVPRRIRFLLRYLVNLGYRNQGLWLSSCRQGAAVAMRYDTIRTGLQGYLDQLFFALFGTGLKKVKPLLAKEAYLKSIRPSDGRFLYVWLVGVMPQSRGTRVFRDMCQELKEFSLRENLDIYYETSVERNVNPYKIMGGEVYHSFDLGGADLRCFRYRH